jgi:hypothetical protein
VQQVQGIDGIANGATVTPANSAASGDAYTTVNSTSATVISDNTHCGHGAQAIKFATSATGVVANCLQTFTAAGTVWFRFYILSTDWTSSQQFGARLRAGSTQALRICFDSTGHIRMHDTGNSVIVTAGVAIANLVLYRVEGTCTPGTTTTGAATVNVYLGDSTTLITSITTSTANLGTAALTEFGVGLFTATANVSPFWIDDTVVNDSGFPGPVNAGSWSPAPQTRRRWLPASRRRPAVTVLMHQGTALHRPQSQRPKAAPLRRSRPPQVVVTPPAPVAPPYVAPAIRPRPRMLCPVRRRQVQHTAANLAPPTGLRAKARAVRLLRGHLWQPPQPPITAAAPQYVAPSHGRHALWGIRPRRATGTGSSVTAAGSCVTPRPSTGITVYDRTTTSRPGTGTTIRPATGTTSRPNTGITDNPC